MYLYSSFLENIKSKKAVAVDFINEIAAKNIKNTIEMPMMNKLEKPKPKKKSFSFKFNFTEKKTPTQTNCYKSTTKKGLMSQYSPLMTEC